jgi:spore coat protein U-like protein
MRRVEPVSSLGHRPNQRRLCHAGAAGVALWLCLSTTAAVATPSCSVSTPGLNFGGYDVFAAGAVNGNGTLSVTCNLNPPPNNSTVNYIVSLSTGSSNSFIQRKMQSGANTLGYNLYTSNTYSVVWGDGTGSTATMSGSMKLKNNNPSQTNGLTVYGQIPALQDAGVGNNYLDNVTVTVSY